MKHETLFSVIFNVVLCIVVSLLLLSFFLHVEIFENKFGILVKSGAGWLFEHLFTLCISITVTVLSQEFVVISSSYFCYLLSAFLLYLYIGCTGPGPVHEKYITWSSVLYNAQLPLFSSLLAVNQIKSSTLRTILCYDQYCNFQLKTFKCTVIVYTV